MPCAGMFESALCCCRDLTQTLQSATEWAKQPIQFRHLPHSVEVLPSKEIKV